jgi:hypothetical protein
MQNIIVILQGKRKEKIIVLTVGTRVQLTLALKG